MQGNHFSGSVYAVTLQLHVHSAHASIKFPCLLSVTCSANHSKHNAQTGKYPLQQGNIIFDETLSMRTEVVYDYNLKQFERKQIHVQLNLVSKSRPKESKLVGRCTLDLASIINQQLYHEATEFPLQFCSVEAHLMLSCKIIKKQETDMSISEFDRSYREELSMSSAIKLRDKTPQQFYRKRDHSPSLSSNKETSGSVTRKDLGGSRQSTTTKSNLFKGKTELDDKKLEEKPQTYRSMQSKSGKKEENTKIQVRQNQVSAFTTVKKTVSINSESLKEVQGKLNEQISRQKTEMEQLRSQSEHYKGEENKLKNEIQSMKRQQDLLKVEIKQKTTFIEQQKQYNHELKRELASTREQLGKNRQNNVSLTLTVAELRDTVSQLTVQCASAQMDGRQLTQHCEKLSQQKDNLIKQNDQLQQLVNKYLGQCQNLQRQRGELQNELGRSREEHKLALLSCASQEESLAEYKRMVEDEIKSLKTELQNQANRGGQLQARCEELEAQLMKTRSIISDYEELRASWEVQGKMREQEMKQSSDRIKELEESLLSLNQRIRFVEGENVLLTQNVRKTREDYAETTKNNDKMTQQSNNKIEKLEKQLLSVTENAQCLEQQKQTLELNYNALREEFQVLTKERQGLKQENREQGDTILRLSKTIDHNNLTMEEETKQLVEVREELELMRRQASLKQRELLVRVAEVEGQLIRYDELLAQSRSEVGRLKTELSAREGLVSKLQEGVSTQMERSEELNYRLMHYLQKQERLKEVLGELEGESRRISQMLAEQQVKQQTNKHIIEEQQFIITQLMGSVEEGSQRIVHLQQTIQQSHQQSVFQMQELNTELSKRDAHIAEVEIELGRSNHQMAELERKIGEIQKNNQWAVEHIRGDMELMKLEKDKQNKELYHKIELLQTEVQIKKKVVQEKELVIDTMKIEAEQLTHKIQEQIMEMGNQRNKIQQLTAAVDNYQQKIKAIEDQMCSKQQVHLQEVIIYQQQQQTFKNTIQELKLKQISTSEQPTEHNQQLESTIKQQKTTIQQLQQQVTTLNQHLETIPNLERSLKIKTIQLNSLKYKSSPQKNQELYELKEQTIVALTKENERLKGVQLALIHTQEKLNQLQTAFDQSEEEKFNIQSLSNQRAIALHEFKEDNAKLYEELALVEQKGTELQKIIEELLAKQPKNKLKSDSSLKAENTLLKKQLKEMENIKFKLTKAEQTNQKLYVQIADAQQKHLLHLEQRQRQIREQVAALQFKQVIPLRQVTVEKPKTLPNLSGTYRAIKGLLEERQSEGTVPRLKLLVSTLLAQESTIGQVPKKAQELTRQFNKVKSQLFKVQSKGPERTKFLAQLRDCENIVKQLLRLSQSIPKQ